MEREAQLVLSLCFSQKRLFLDVRTGLMVFIAVNRKEIFASLKSSYEDV